MSVTYGDLLQKLQDRSMLCVSGKMKENPKEGMKELAQTDRERT